MKRRIAILLLALVMTFSCTPSAFADAAKVTNVVSNGSSLVATTTGGNKVCYMMYKGYSIVCQGDAVISGGSANIKLPTGLTNGVYKVSVWCVSGDTQGDVSTFTVTCGTGGSNLDGALRMSIGQEPQNVATITVPYASVYSSSSMGTEIAQLVRHEFVEIIKKNDSVAHIKYNIQSGQGSTTEVGEVEAEYDYANDMVGEGWIYTSALSRPLIATQNDAEHEVVELAHSRLGTKGVYNQRERFKSVYLDCSALVTWCYYQIGYKIYDGGTNCNTIGQYIENGQHDSAIVWKAKYKISKEIPDSATELFFWSRQYNTIATDSIAVDIDTSECGDFPNTVSAMDELLKHGDIIMFNKKYTTPACIYLDENGVEVSVDLKNAVVLQDSPSNHTYANKDAALEAAEGYLGYDHTGIYIGEGMIIEAAGTNSNTIKSSLISSIDQIVAVYRPLNDASLKMD